jgi:hypothetical protein
MSFDGWLYMIQKGDHRKHNEEIYKIGRTNNFNIRINEYPAYSQIICATPVDNDRKCEREYIKEFKNEFEFRNDISNEYFEENERDMISVFNDYISEHLPKREEEDDMDYHWEIEDQRMKAERNQMRNKMEYMKQWYYYYIISNYFKFIFVILFFILNVKVFLHWKIH